MTLTLQHYAEPEPLPEGSMAPEQRTKYAASVWRNELAALAAAERGSRNSQLFKTCATLANFVPAPWASWTAEEIRAAVHAAAEGTASNPDPWDAWTTAYTRTMEGALRSGVKKPREVPIVADNDAAFAGIQARADAARARHAAEPESGPLPLRRWTDVGNAATLVDRYGKDMRFVPSFGRWLSWTGIRWESDEVGSAIESAKAVTQALYDESKELEKAADPNAKKLKAHAKKSESLQKIRAMVALATTDPRVVVRVKELDADPWRLAVGNGVIDLRTGELVPPCRTQLVTRGTDVCYDPDAQAPEWIEFLAEIFLGDTELVGFIRRAVGYSLTGSTKEQCFFLLHGEGSNGKSTLLETLRALLGAMGDSTPFTTLLEQRYAGIPNDIAALRGARLVTAAEPKEGARFDMAVIKALTGEDHVKARFLNQEFFEFTPALKLWLSVNRRPTITATDHGTWRRVRLIPFNATFKGAEEDQDLKIKLLEELPGILAWAVRGCLEWQRDGLAPPAAVRDEVERYKHDSNKVLLFLDECCDQNTELATPKRALYKAWKIWAEGEGYGDEVGNSATFGRRLKGMFPDGRQSRQDGHARTYCGVGIRGAR